MGPSFVVEHGDPARFPEDGQAMVVEHMNQVFGFLFREWRAVSMNHIEGAIFVGKCIEGMPIIEVDTQKR